MESMQLGEQAVERCDFLVICCTRIKVMFVQSTFTLALLRCILTEGVVYYDGLATNTINLDALRSNITIIPQTVSPLYSNSVDS